MGGGRLNAVYIVTLDLQQKQAITIKSRDKYMCLKVAKNNSEECKVMGHQ